MARRGIRGFVPSKFQEARLRAGFDLSELEQLSGVTNQALSKWETGQSTPSPNKLRLVVEVLEYHNPTPRAPITIASLTSIAPEQALLEDLRGWAGLTHADVASKVGIGETTSRDIESALKPLSSTLAPTLAEAYGVEVGELHAAAARTTEHRLSELRARRDAARPS